MLQTKPPTASTTRTATVANWPPLRRRAGCRPVLVSADGVTRVADLAARSRRIFDRAGAQPADRSSRPPGFPGPRPQVGVDQEDLVGAYGAQRLKQRVVPPLPVERVSR